MTSEEFYEKKNVVDSYNRVRFLGAGGDYINNKELKSVLNLLGDISGKEVMEVGPGTGRLSEILIKKTNKLTLFDSSAEMLSLLKKKFSNKKGITFLKGDLRKLKLTKSYDLYVSLRVFIHLTEKELKQALLSASRSLKKEGFLLFDSLNSNSLYPMIKPASLLRKKYPYNHFISEQKMRNIIKECGFRVVDLKKIFVLPKFIIRYSFPISFPLIKLNEILEKRMRFLSTHFFWKIQKI